MTQPLTDSVERFLRRYVSSVSQLHLLLCVAATVDRGSVSVEAAAHDVYLPLDLTQAWLDQFVQAGMCDQEDGGYRVAAEPGLRALIGKVATAYRLHPLAVEQLIRTVHASRAPA